MTEQQIELLAEIQRLALSCRDQANVRIAHEVQAWPDGETWSECRIIDNNCMPIFDSTVCVERDGREARIFSYHVPNTLIEQRDALASWIAANRKEKAA